MKIMLTIFACINLFFFSTVLDAAEKDDVKTEVTVIKGATDTKKVLGYLKELNSVVLNDLSDEALVNYLEKKIQWSKKNEN